MLRHRTIRWSSVGVIAFSLALLGFAVALVGQFAQLRRLNDIADLAAGQKHLVHRVALLSEISVKEPALERANRLTALSHADDDLDSAQLVLHRFAREATLRSGGKEALETRLLRADNAIE